ncbi:hypothetical protein GCM10008908_24590 [Clostridium subterminale]|uniref:Uncharacterized protein n=1 Tax=Clostridium subterminale TaxID=1550 RepID=A0ABP3W2B9_CLOSU
MIYIILILISLSGFSIETNGFHYEYKGLIAILFKLIYGEELNK